MAVKKMGSETPASAVIIATRSTTVPRLRAETTPVETPMSSHRIAAPMTMDRVTGKASTSIAETSCSVRNEYPKQGAAQWIVLPPPV
jgi:hypothetical protein